MHDGKIKAGFVARDAKKVYNNFEKRENFKDKIAHRRYPIENKGFKREGIYRADSTALKWAVARGKRDGYTMQGITMTDPKAGSYVVLFSKKVKKQRKITSVRNTGRKTTAVCRAGTTRKTKMTTAKPRMWHGLPMTKVIGNVTYHLQNEFDDDEQYEAKNEAAAYRQDGYTVKLQHLNDQWGERRYALYTTGRKSRSQSSY